MNDTKRAATIGLVQSAFPVLLLTGLVSLSEQEIGAIMLLVANALTVVALYFKKGQEPGTP